MAHVNNKPIATPTIKGGNGNGEYGVARKVYPHNRPPTCRSQGDGDGGST